MIGKPILFKAVVVLAWIVGWIAAFGFVSGTGTFGAYPVEASASFANGVAQETSAPTQARLATSGTEMLQTFTLQAGWNTLYLEVEPVNTSPLINIGTAAAPVMIPERSTLEMVFAGVESLESVWSWNVPQSRRDYIVDPAEGLWDEPGWKRYFPATAQGRDGGSQEFLTDLLSLHANNAYLVKLADNFVGSVTVTVQGQPVVRNRRWVLGSYNLTGFPVLPGASPTVATFFANSPVSEVNRLTPAGVWMPMASTETLAYGKAYLVFYDDPGTDGVTDYTAPLGILEPLSGGLTFTAGAGGNRASFTIQNLSAVATSVDLAWVGTSSDGVALRLIEPAANATQLSEDTARISLTAGQAVPLRFTVLSTEQRTNGAGFLQVAAPGLGVRWLLPVTAKSGSRAGLWIGEVTVNDVSEGRLGGTNVDDGLLTVALRQVNQSGILGAVTLKENTLSANVTATVTLAVPAPAVVNTAHPEADSTPYLSGYLFVDLNQNGERDGNEPGLPNISVLLDGSATAVTAADGFYRFHPVAAGAHALSISSGTPSGFTSDFSVTTPLGITRANRWPKSSTLDATGVTQVTWRTQAGTEIAESDFPRYDVADNRVEPSLNFGFVSAYDLSLWTSGVGGCADRLDRIGGPWQVINGALTTVLGRASLNPSISGAVENELLSDSIHYVLLAEQVGGGGVVGKAVACGEIVVGAPTSFANGAGSEFTFRVILRVHEDGRTQILPSYVITNGLRISTPNFSIRKPVQASGRFIGGNGLLDFGLIIDAQDPLNPFKHKYHPDHDNRDAKFNPYPETLSPYLWEAFAVRRRLLFSLTDDPPGVEGAEAQALAIKVDWGGAVWGGLYQEVIQGVHKNPITVKGYFVIQHALTEAQLTAQPYDR